MFCKKSLRIMVLTFVLVFSILVLPSLANVQAIQRLPVLYKYNENHRMNTALSLLTGGSNKWAAECVVNVVKNDNGSYFPLLVFTTPDRSKELGGFIGSLGYAESLLGVSLGIVNNSSGNDTLGRGIFLSYEIWKEGDQLWSNVTFENQGGNYYSECEFGCTPKSCEMLLSVLNEDTLASIAATM